MRRDIWKTMKVLSKNCLLNPNQSGFRLLGLYDYELFTITHEMLETFDCNQFLKTRAVLLDPFKAFNREWHEYYLYQYQTLSLI